MLRRLSPLSGRSTLITSAPKSAEVARAVGPGQHGRQVDHPQVGERSGLSAACRRRVVRRHGVHRAMRSHALHQVGRPDPRTRSARCAAPGRGRSRGRACRRRPARRSQRVHSCIESPPNCCGQVGDVGVHVERAVGRGDVGQAGSGQAVEQHRAVACGTAVDVRVQLVGAVEGGDARHLADVRRTDVQVLLQPLDGGARGAAGRPSSPAANRSSRSTSRSC